MTEKLNQANKKSIRPDRISLFANVDPYQELKHPSRMFQHNEPLKLHYQNIETAEKSKKSATSITNSGKKDNKNHSLPSQSLLKRQYSSTSKIKLNKQQQTKYFSNDFSPYFERIIDSDPYKINRRITNQMSKNFNPYLQQQDNNKNNQEYLLKKVNQILTQVEKQIYQESHKAFSNEKEKLENKIRDLNINIVKIVEQYHKIQQNLKETQKQNHQLHLNISRSHIKNRELLKLIEQLQKKLNLQTIAQKNNRSPNKQVNAQMKTKLQQYSFKGKHGSLFQIQMSQLCKNYDILITDHQQLFKEMQSSKSLKEISTFSTLKNQYTNHQQIVKSSSLINWQQQQLSKQKRKKCEEQVIFKQWEEKAKEILNKSMAEIRWWCQELLKAKQRIIAVQSQNKMLINKINSLLNNNNKNDRTKN